MRHGAHDGDVVGDEQVAQTPARLQVLQQVKHLFLDGYIERTGGLIHKADAVCARRTA